MKLKHLFLLVFCLMFFNSCTYLAVETVTKLDNFLNDSTQISEVTEFINLKFDSNFVDIQTLKKQHDSLHALQTIPKIQNLDTIKTVSIKLDSLNLNLQDTANLTAYNNLKDSLLKDSLRINKQRKDSNTVEAEYKISAKITSINSNNYPDSIVISAIVTDNAGNFISGLAAPYILKDHNYKEYWKFIIDSCKEQPETIEDFTVEEIRESSSPKYSICYVLDHSPSMGNERTVALQQSVRYSISKVKAGDYLSAIKFTNKATVEVLPTTDKEKFKEQFKLNGMISRYGMGTDILLALDSAAELLKTISDEYKRIIILFTDGSSNILAYNKVIGKLRQNNIKVFTVCYGETDFKIMLKIARDTDGRMFFLQNVKQFSKAFQYIYNMLTNYYKITYKPPFCEDLHKVTLNISLNELGFEKLEGHGHYDKSKFTNFVEVGTVTLMDIEFEYNKSTLTEESLKLLVDIANQLKRNKNVNIEICGHTDDRGGDDYNMHLSLERAKSVRNELIKLGVENNRLKVKGYGKTKPIVPNDTEENRKKNRRTEFIVIE